MDAQTHFNLFETTIRTYGEYGKLWPYLLDEQPNQARITNLVMGWKVTAVAGELRFTGITESEFLAANVLPPALREADTTDFDRLANLILDYGRKVDFSRLSRPCTILADQYALEAIYTLNGVFYGESDSTFVIFDRLLQWSVVISSANESDVQELKGIDKAGLGVVYSSLLSTLE